MGGCKNEPKAEDVAMNAAKVYYDQLLQGDYAAFVAGTDGFDSIPEFYREQLEMNMKMFIAQQKKDHGGIRTVNMARAKADTVKVGGVECVTAEVFLTFCYGDSTQEQVVVPMIEREGAWKLR